MLFHLIILSVITVSQNYAAVNVKQESRVRTERDETQANKYSFLALVNIGNNSCAGAVLSDSWVVTARACGNTTAQEPGWVYAGSDASKVQKRHIARQHSCPDNHCLLLLQLEQPFTFDDALSAVPIVRPGTFSGHEGTCEVITFGDEPSEKSLGTAHAVETRLAAGSECLGSVNDSNHAVQKRSAEAPSPDTAHNATSDKAATKAAANETQSSDDTNPTKVSGDAGKKERDTLRLEAVSPAIVDANPLCSPEINEAAGLKLLGSPVICQGILIALVTPKPSNEASREKKEDTKTYYTAIGPDYSWILEMVPGVEVVSWNEVAKEGRSARSKIVGSSPGESRFLKHKMHSKDARKRRFSRLVNILAAATPDKVSSGPPKVELEDELEPQLRLNKILSVWFPLARRIRGIILLNRMLVQPESEIWGDLSEKTEAALRPLRRVKRSNPEEDAEGPTGDAKESQPLLQPWSFRRAKREDNAKQQKQCEEASDGRSKRSAGGDIGERVPCVTEAKAHRGTTRLAQRLAVVDKSKVSRWKESHGYPVNTP